MYSISRLLCISKLLVPSCQSSRHKIPPFGVGLLIYRTWGQLSGFCHLWASLYGVYRASHKTYALQRGYELREMSLQPSMCYRISNHIRSRTLYHTLIANLLPRYEMSDEWCIREDIAVIWVLKNNLCVSHDYAYSRGGGVISAAGSFRQKGVVERMGS